MLSTELMKQQVIPLFFSTKGRISRGLFWKSNFVLLLGFLTLICFLMAIEQIFSLTNNERILGILIAIILSYLYAVIVLMVKRLHDINWSGWLAIISILTPLGFIVGLIPSKPGMNSHGNNLIEYEKNRLYVNRNSSLPPPPPPIDNPISKIILCLMMVLPIPSFVVAGMVMPKKVEKPAMEQVAEVSSSEQEILPVAEEPQKETVIKLDFIKQVYSDELNEDTWNNHIDVLEKYASYELRKIISKRNDVSSRYPGEQCDWVYMGQLIPGNDRDTRLEDMQFTMLDNGLVRAEFYNFGKKHQVDFDIQCDGQECKIADVYEPNSYKQELQQIVQKGVCYMASGLSVKEVTVVVQKINDFSESGDGYTFLTKDGQEYYVYNAGGASPRPGEVDIEENGTICLKLNPSDGMGDVAAVSKGKCRK
ncbi:DUF805 domain-containing protein [Acinetobacter venetianus]|uniref:DUF805 domain-containing protein n=1 Tax=Acinetobacter venetianus TaxID=52133 RepID=UPI0035BE54C1